MFEKLVGKVGYNLLSWEYSRQQRHAMKGVVGPLIDDHRIFRSLRELLGPYSAVVQQPYKQSVWVYACFPAGTPILTDNGVCNIEDMEVGDVVYNHLGKQDEVIEVKILDYTGKLFSLKCNGLPPIQATSEHPFYVERDGGRQWVETKDIQIGDYLLTPVIDIIEDKEKWVVKVENKGRKDKYKKHEQEVLVNNDLLLLIGYYLAEGNVRVKKCGPGRVFPSTVQFTFSIEERFFVDETKSLMQKCFGISHSLEAPSEGRVSVLFNSRIASDFFLLFGTGASYKKIPDWVAKLPIEKTMFLLRGFWRGDGCESPNGDFNLDTISPSLVEGLRFLLLRQGIVPYVFKKEGCRRWVINQMCDCRDSFRLRIGGGYKRRANLIFKNMLWKKEKGSWNAGKSICAIEKGYAKFPVNKIGYEKVNNLPVFNLEVRKEHSYLAFGVATHNCINAIMSNIARVPFIIRKDAGDDIEPKRVEEGPIYELFQNPNPLMTLSKLIEATFGFYEMAGEAFWILEGRDDVSQIPKEIWTFPPSRFEPVIDIKTNWLLGWKYSGKIEVIFPLSQIIHFKMFNPYNDLRGLSPLEASKLSVESDYHASMYNKVFFENGAVTSLNITVPEELNDDSYDRMLKQFEDRHKGSKKAHRIVIAEGGAKITESRLGQRDMEFIDGKKMSREEIFAAYSVNEVVLGLFKDVKSYEGSKAAHKAFWEECLMPKVTYFEEVLWAKFFSRIGVRRGKGRIWGEFDLATVGALQENYKDKVVTAKLMWSMGWPINMINKRLQLGMQDVKWGNDAFIPGGYSSYAYIMAHGGAQNQAPGKDKPEAPKEESKKVIEMVKTPMIENNPYQIYKQPIEKEFKAKIKTLLFNQRKDALEAVYEDRDIDRSEKCYGKLQRELKEVFFTAVYRGQYSVWNEIGASSEQPSNGNDAEIARFIDAKTSFVVSNFKALIGNLIDAFEQFKSKNGNDKEVFAEKVREIYNYLTQKSYTVAENEVDTAFYFGRNIEMERARKEINTALAITKQDMSRDDWIEAWKNDPHWATSLNPSPLAKAAVKAEMMNTTISNVLDIGCGNGRDSIFFGEQGYNVIGIDLSPEAVEIAKGNNKLKNVSFEVGDAEALRFGRNTFDLVYSLSVLHSTKMDASIKEVSRVLKNKGMSLLYLYIKTTYYTPGGEEDRTEINFKISEIEELYKKNSLEVRDKWRFETKDKDENGTHIHSVVVYLLQKELVI